MALLQKTSYTLTIVILNYKTDTYTLELLKKLTPQAEVEVIVIDNSPTRELETKLPARNDLSYIFTGKNLGFAGGNNQGIKAARGEWILLLNNDTLTTAEDLLSLVQQTKQANALTGTPRLMDKNKNWQKSVGYFDGIFQNPLNYIFARPRYLQSDKTKTEPVDFAHFTAILFHKSVFETIGFLDETDYFMYFEDIDYCWRLKQKKIPILYVPEITITHFGGASSDLDKQQKNINYQNSLQKYLIKHRGKLIATLNTAFKIFR